METLEQRLQRLVPGRVAPAAPGTAATKTVLNKPAPRPELKYTPSPMDTKVREIESAIGRFVPDFIKDFGREQEKKGFAEALLPAAMSAAPGLGGLLPRAVVGGAAEAIVPIAIPGKEVVSEKPRFADLRGSATPGSMTPATDNSAADKAFSDAAKFQAERSTGTDTGSGDREVTRVAQTDNMDDNMKAWAAANPELAQRMVDKVDARRNKGLEGKQSGYETVRDAVYPERAVLAKEGNQGSFSARDAVGGGMSAQNAINIGSGGFVETLIDGDKATQVSSAPGKAQAFAAKRIKQQIDAPGGALPASEIQNPIIPDTDGTPVDSELELQNKTYAKEKYVRDPIKDMMVLVK